METSSTKLCRKCGSVKPIAQFSKHPQMKDGRLNFCKPCVYVRSRDSLLKAGERQRRKKGVPTIDGTKSKTLRKARKAEKRVASSMRSFGWHAKLGNGKGPDIVAEKDGITKTVEVKTVFRHSRCRSLYVSVVSSARKNDDLIALVSNRWILIEPMKKHLSKCSKNGKRCVTSLFPVR